MIKRILIFITLILILVSCNTRSNKEKKDGRTITDMAGRKVTIPNKIDKVFSNIASGTMILYTIDPDLLIGWNYNFNDEEKKYIIDEYENLPSYGQGDKINNEAIISAAPDIIITYNSMSDKEIEDANTLQNTTNIPVVMVDHSLNSSPESYRFLGEILNMESRCELLATYAETALAFADDLHVTEKVSVYYGNGIDSLETVPVGSSHAELFELVGADNVIPNEGKVVNRINVSPEQIISENPDVIILNGEPDENISPIQAVENFKNDPRYQNINAVKNNKVYAIPKYPYSFFDRPQSTNRLIGIYWLSELLYPDIVNINIKQETKNFYKLFYHLELNDEQVAYLGVN